MRIDLHTHSTASDGSLTPAQLVQHAATVELDVVALTDHDTTAGWAPAMAALPAGLVLIRGAELSCGWRRATEHPMSVHLLAYLFDAHESEFRAARARTRQARMVRGERIVERMRGDGIEISWDEVLIAAGDAPVGRPHVGKVLLARGFVATMSEAFGPDWLGYRYRVPAVNIEIFTAIRMVRNAGGVPVLAHPRAAKRGRTLPAETIAELARAGLAGLEADHADHDPAQRQYLHTLADELDLFVTGSSDFHGAHKTVQLGANATTTPAVYQELVGQASGCQPVVSS